MSAAAVAVPPWSIGTAKIVLTSSCPARRTIAWTFQVPYIAVTLPSATYSPGARWVVTSSVSPMSCSTILNRRTTFSGSVSGRSPSWMRST